MTEGITTFTDTSLQEHDTAIRNATLDDVKQYADTCVWVGDYCCPGKINDKEESDCDGCSYVDYPNNADICEKIESLRSTPAAAGAAMTDEQPPNCSTCSYFGGHYCSLLKERLMSEETYLIKRVGCLFHPDARAWLMRDMDYEDAIKIIRDGKP